MALLITAIYGGDTKAGRCKAMTSDGNSFHEVYSKCNMVPLRDLSPAARATGGVVVTQSADSKKAVNYEWRSTLLGGVR